MNTVTYTWDAWNRPVKVEYGSSVRAHYQYNGLNWRTVKRSDTSSPPNGTLNQQRVMYYNAAWQLMEELINDSWTTSSSNDDHDRRMQYVWGLRYIDDIAVRRELEPIGTLGPGTKVTTWYHLSDTLFSTVAILDDSAQLVERVSYDAYGRARHHRMADLTGDGGVDTSDRDAMRGTNWGDYGVGDLNRDGVVDSADLALLNAVWGRGLAEGQISATDNVIGYAGYIFNAEMHGAGLYTVRHRHYDPELGRWISRDPLGYVDGMGLYEYVRSAPSFRSDPSGLNVVWHPPLLPPEDGEDGWHPPLLPPKPEPEPAPKGPPVIRCIRIPGLPASHCFIDFGDGTVCGGHQPPGYPLTPGPIHTECKEWGPDSKDWQYWYGWESDDLFDGKSTTSIKCPPGTDYGAIKRCIQDVFDRIGECKIPYDAPFGPNSNTVVRVAFERCLAKAGCKLRFGHGDPAHPRPRTRPGAPPIGWEPLRDHKEKLIDDCLDRC